MIERLRSYGVQLETGENPNPTVDTLEKLAKALGVPVAELFK